MPKVFISYRRSDAQEEARRVADRTIDEFGASSVFYDTDTMGPGVSFPDEIQASIATCGAMLVMIGPDWLHRDPATGQRRIDDPDDWVRNEVRLGLAGGKLVIPVLVKNAQMPGRSDLPDDMKPLADQNAVALTPETFKGQLDTLTAMLQDKSPLQAAGIVLVSSIIAGLIYYFVTDIYRVLALVLDSVEAIGRSGPSFAERQRPFDDGWLLGSDAIAAQAARYRQETGAGALTQGVVSPILAAIYWAMVTAGALTAARGYVGIGRERILPAVFVAGCLYVLTVFLFRAANTWAPALAGSLAGVPVDGAPLGDVVGWAYYTPFRDGVIYSAFAAGILIMLRRDLRARSSDIVLAVVCLFVASVLSRYAISWTWWSAHPLSSLAGLIEDSDMRDTLFSHVDALVARNGKIWTHQVLDQSPICLTATIAQGAKACAEMDYMIRLSLRFALLLGFAALLLRWRLSAWPPVLMGLGLLLFSLILVNAIAMLEFATLDGSRFFADASIVQAFLFAGMAYLLARWPIRRHDTPLASGNGNKSQPG